MYTYIIADVQKIWVGGTVYFGKQRKKKFDIKVAGVYGHKLKSSNIAVTLVKDGLYDFNIDFDSKSKEKMILVTPIATAKPVIGKLGKFEFLQR